MTRSHEPRSHPDLDAFVREHAALGDWPGGVYAVGLAGAAPSWRGAAGALATVPALEQASLSALYDLASLTKVLATSAISLSLSDAGDLDLEAPLDDLLPELRGYGGRTPTFADLLAHRAGFPAWLPLARSGGSESEVIAEIAKSQPGPVDVAMYTDLGPICAGIALQRLTRTDLGTLLNRYVSGPLDLSQEDLRFGPFATAELERIAPTEMGRAKEAAMVTRLSGHSLETSGESALPLRGVVHDGNAAAMGGVAGHAGLFGTADAVFRVASAFVCEDGPLSESARRRARTPLAASADDVRGFGFQLGSATSAPAGGFGPASFGHVGFTGTSVWIAHQSRWVAVLLTNRVHPVWREAPMQQWRREFHDRVARQLMVGKH